MFQGGAIKNYQGASSSTKMAARQHCLYRRLQTILQMVAEILVLVHISLDNNVTEDRLTEWYVTHAHFLLGTIIYKVTRMEYEVPVPPINEISTLLLS